jgi:hypothetical protein
MMLCVRILWDLGAFEPHSKLMSKYLDACEQHQHEYMDKHTHDKTISIFLSTHAPLIYKQDPTPNPSFPIYQMI